MARIRSIKPEVRISEKVNSWPIECRYFWVLLWGYCDDYGYGRDNARLIVADSFPLDDTITAEMVSGWMDILWRDGVIERYVVGDSQYFQIVNWDEHQKISHPAKQVLPAIHEATEILRRPSVIPREDVKPFEKVSPKQGAGSREKEQGAGEQVMALVEPNLRPNLPLLFEQSYEHWPKKVKRDEAYDRYVQACKKNDPHVIAAAIAKFGDAYEATTDKQYIPALGPWLFQKRWTDELPSKPKPPDPDAWMRPTRTDQNLAYVSSLYGPSDEQLEIEG